MAQLRESDLPQFLKNKVAASSALLIYGSDEAGVRSAADQVISVVGKTHEVRRIAGPMARAEPAFLDEMVRSMSLLGGRELIVVDDCEDALAGAVNAFPSGGAGNFVLMLASSLSKGSKLRLAFEGATSCFALPIYEAKPQDVMQRVAVLLARDELRLSAEAAQLFSMVCGHDAGLALREAEKLALYALGQGEVSADDVAAVLGDYGSDDIDAVITAVLDGDVVRTDQNLSLLDESVFRSLFPLFSSHLSRLQGIRSAFDETGQMDQALAAARPPLFAMLRERMGRQVRRMPLAALMDMQAQCDEASELGRKQPGLARQIGERALLRMAHGLRALR